MSDHIDRDRRLFLGTAATTITAASLGMLPSARAQSRDTQQGAVHPSQRRSNTSFSSLKQIDAGLLNIRSTGSSADRPISRSGCRAA